jgi:20S proteasome alpha/beta subunit
MVSLSQRLRSTVVCLICVGGSLASTRDSSGVSAPVRHFEPSWAASGAQGTAVALRVEDSVLVFLRSPASNIWRPSSKSPQSPEEMIAGLRVTPIQPAQAQFAPSWLSVGPNSFCAMTGLASDVEHLSRVLQKQVDAHWNIYDKHLTTHSMTMGLAETFQQATFSGSRPFGVQVLLVGGDDYDEERTFCVYSIDPSGTWQSWGGTTAIGKYAKSVREELAKKRRIKPTSLKEALEQIVDCWMETCKNQNINLHSSDDYQVLVLRKQKGDTRCKVYVVEEEDVQTIVDHALAAAQTK